MIVSESEEVAAIVEDLLVAARAESGELTISAEPIRLDQELRAMAEVCEVPVTLRRVESTTVVGDRVRIHQVVRNLTTNADRYGGDLVILEAYPDGNVAVLAVRDDGAGVPAERLDVVFTAFAKGHRDPGRTDSVGLGLTVSQNLARLMGGDVVYRRVDGWTSFELHLPLADDHLRGVNPDRALSLEERPTMPARH